jgi:1,4-dihydroxy-2-naphthoate octaprenyltransferase
MRCTILCKDKKTIFADKMKVVKRNSLRAWFLAVRFPTLPASVTPVAVASALAFSVNAFRWQPALICLLFAVLAQVIANFANDYYDFIKGSDNAERQGPRRAVVEGWVSPKAMLYVALLLLVVDAGIGMLLIYYGGWQLIFVGLVVALFALGYSGGPYPLAYHGLGDICVLIFFGIIPVGFTYYIQTGQWNIATVLCGIACGLVTTNILIANNYRDRFTDKKTDKITSIVMFGERFGEMLYLVNGLIAVLCCQYFWFTDTFGAACLPFLYLPFHIQTWKSMITIKEGVRLNQILGKSARNVLVFGALLIIGLLFV